MFFIVIVMAMTASSIMFFTHRDVGEAMRKAEKSAAQNVLNLVGLNIKGGYDKLLADRYDTVIKRRKQLVTLCRVAVNVLQDFNRLFSNRKWRKKDARKHMTEWLRSVPPDEETALFIFDKKGRIVAHQNRSIEGILIDDLKDMKGRNILTVMHPDTLISRGDFAVFRWKNDIGQKLGYFVPFRVGGWTIAAMIDISDIEAESQEKLDKIVSILETTFSEIKIEETGSVFLFNDKMDILIPPRGHDKYHFDQNNPQTRQLLKEMMENDMAGFPSFTYNSSPDGRGRTMIAYTSYFKTLGWYIVVTVPIEEINRTANVLLTRQSIIVVLIFIVSLIATVLLVMRISRPLNMLTSYAKEIPMIDFLGEQDKKSPIDNLPKQYKDEVGRLASAFIFMRLELQENIRDLMETTAAKERIQSELDVAREIQMGLLNKIFPPFPDNREFDLHATIEPAKEVGGDLYDFFFIDEDHLCFALGDVSDKGVPAALFMSITMTLIRNTARQMNSPADIMASINDTLSAENPRSMFVTLIIGILNIRTGAISYSNGGHNPPILIQRDGKPVYKKEISGPIVGPIDNIPYKDLFLTLNPGDILFLYTDGVTEALNEKNELFSEERLIAEMETVYQDPVEDITRKIRVKIREHTRSEPQSDDIAMLTIRFNGPEKG
jgi:sigma-B regulation protein RsbU (phosphoserine phosphatase)